jgi:hypothetical protein
MKTESEGGDPSFFGTIGFCMARVALSWLGYSLAEEDVGTTHDLQSGFFFPERNEAVRLIEGC